MSWIVVLAACAAAGSYGAGKGAKAVYNTKGESIDLVKISGADRLCS